MRPAVKCQKMDKTTGFTLISAGIALISLLAGIVAIWGANVNRTADPCKCSNSETSEQFRSDGSLVSKHQKTDKKIVIAWISAAGSVLVALITAAALVWITYLHGSAVPPSSGAPSPSQASDAKTRPWSNLGWGSAAVPAYTPSAVPGSAATSVPIHQRPGSP
jgi:hypothetical protein